MAPPAAPPTRPRPLALERVATTFAVVALLIGMLVPSNAFATARDWSISRTPSTITGGAPADIEITVVNTGGSGGSEAIGCVVVEVPASGFSVTNAVIDSVSNGGGWSASVTTDGTTWFVRLASDSSGGSRLHGDPAEWLRATITVQDTGLDGTFTWVGNAYNKYDCTDDFFMPKTLSVTVDAAATNTAPSATDDGYTVAKNTALSVDAPGVLGNDDDPNGDPMTAILATSPTNGGLAWGGDGSFVYTPNPGFVGVDTFTYQAHDGVSTSAAATVTVTVTNSAPVATDDLYATAWLVPISEPAPGFLGNDTDADGDSLSATIVSGPSNGSLLPNADGSFTYVPGLLFTGTDSFVYEVTDGIAAVQATVSIVVSNAAPVAVGDGPYAGTEDATLSVPAPGVLANDTDPDGHAISAQLVADAANGAVTLAADGSFDYVPDPDFNGADSFTYRATDGLDTSAEQTVTIAVAAVNDAPTATPDAYAATEDTTLVVPAPGLLANDGDVDGDPLVASLATNASSGSAIVAPDGSFQYVPDPDTNGVDAFTYSVTDGTTTVTETVTVTVAPVNDAPVVAPDIATVPAGGSVLIDALANDSDADDDALTLASVGVPTTGTAAIEGGRVRYTPAAGFSGTAAFSYTASDGVASATGSVAITVTPPVPLPTPTPTPTPAPQTPTATPTPTPEPSSGSEPEPTVVPSGAPVTAAPSPMPTPQPPPSAPATPEPTPQPSPSSSPTPSPQSPPTGGTDGDGEDRVMALETPELTTAFELANQMFSLEDLFGTLGGRFGWAVPAAVLGIPGLLFMLAVIGQLFGAAAWVPVIRRLLAGVGVRRRSPIHTTTTRESQ